MNSVMTVVAGTLVAPLAGRELRTLGAVVITAMVVNWLVVSARALPERSVIRWLAVAVMVAPAGRFAPLELTTTVRLSCEMEIAGLIGTSPLNRLTELLLMVVGLMDFEKVSTTCVLSPRFVVPLEGVMVTVGGVESTVVAVAKDPPLRPLAILPASSIKPSTNMPIVALAGYGVSGVKVIVAPATLYLPATYVLPQAPMQTSTFWVLTDAGSIKLLMVNVTGLVTDMLLAPLAGLVETRVNDEPP